MAPSSVLARLASGERGARRVRGLVERRSALLGAGKGAGGGEKVDRIRAPAAARGTNGNESSGAAMEGNGWRSIKFSVRYLARRIQRGLASQLAHLDQICGCRSCVCISPSRAR